MAKITSLEKSGIYTDLMRKFRDEGHSVYIVSPIERKEHKKTQIQNEKGAHILTVRTLNVKKTSILEKGLGQVSIEWLYKRAIRKHYKDVSFDLILYSTPPITLIGVVKELKRHNPKAISYLLLKDIFPQNAVDMGMMRKNGWKGFLYRHFRKQEKELYKESDFIGCMSPANVKYLLEHNHFINSRSVEVAPNSIQLTNDNKVINPVEIRCMYGLPTDKPVFIYGGNLGKPQGIPFLVECLEEVKHRKDCHFVIVGTGTHLPVLQKWYENNKNTCVTVMNGLPKEDYDQLVQACDVGLIFLDYRFTIPNFPSRLLSYLENKMAIIACTDPVCDMGSIAEENGFGFFVPSNDTKLFAHAISNILSEDIKVMGQKGYSFFRKNYLVDNTYNAIINHFNV